jgi:glucose/mannose transport system substrate-binding protein
MTIAARVAAMLAVGCVCSAPAWSAAPRSPATSLQVLHWWTSAGERKAADVLARHLSDEGIEWKDAAIPGGAGMGAGKVLRSRVLADNPPEVTQIIGVSIGEWASMGLLHPIDGVAAAGKWRSVLFPTVYDLIRNGRHVVAAPLGIHRINTLFYNRQVMQRIGLTPPSTWPELERAAQKLWEAGVTPLAQSSEPWQVATLFENLVLAEGGPALHRDLFVRHSIRAVGDRGLVAALEHLRQAKSWMKAPVAERPWTEMVHDLAQGKAAMLVMGDWAKGELKAGGAAVDVDFGCVPMARTGAYHLYSVDTLTMLAGDSSHAQAQDKLARMVVMPAVQAEYNEAKGSVPVRRDADPDRMDSCGRASWTAFGRDAIPKVPSLAHRMATDEASKDAIVAEIHRYFVDDAMAPEEAQRRLIAVFRALPQWTLE